MPEEKAVKKKRGRPSLPKGERKLASLGFRPTPELRAQLDKAASANDRSVAQEVQSRLERSFQKESDFGGAELFSLFKMLAGAAELIEARTKKSWSKDFDTFLAFETAWKKIIQFTRPQMPTKMKHDFDASAKESTERAKRLLSPPPSPPRPQAPQSKGLLNLPDVDDAAWDSYTHELEVWKATNQAELANFNTYSEAMREHGERFKILEEIGSDAAASIFPPHKE
ncbi:MAG: Arc family DNA-binding protein [Alphaproteobacteria bacterium]|nr:Arc family DNA-binding protein [Alphaproteobacteria bacterium]MBT4020645.1 Arc family DNA-binding protein [Alphaproteobacteria bacterium]